MQQQTLNVNGATYTVTEQPMRVILPLLEGDSARLGIELMKVCVTNGSGQPLGEAVLDMGFREFQQLLGAVNAVHGLGEEADAGNAP